MKIIDRKDAINHHKDGINRRLYKVIYDKKIPMLQYGSVKDNRRLG